MVFLSEICLLQQQNRTAGEAGGLIIGRFFCRKYKKKDTQMKVSGRELS